MSTLKKFAGQTVIYGLSTVLSRVLSFLLTKLYVKLYPAKVYGVFINMYAWASILNAVLAFGMETTFFRYLNKSEHDKEKVYSNTFIIILFLCSIFLVIAFVFSGNIALWLLSDDTTSLSDYEHYVRFFILILVVDSLSVIPFARLRADGRPLRFGMIRILNILSFIGFNLFLLVTVPSIIANKGFLAEYFTPWYREGWLGYVFISNLVASCLTLLFLLPEFRKLKFSFDKPLVLDMLSYSFPVLIANLSFIINENSDKIFLKELLPPNNGAQEAGIYGACGKIAIFLMIFIQAFRLGAEPFFFSHAKNKNSGETYSKIMNYFIIAISLIFVGIAANIEILKHFIGSDNPVQRELYWSGLKIIPILLLGYVSLGIYMNLSIWYKLSDQTRFGLYISGIGAILTIVLNVLFIPEYGYIASAWISFTAYTTMMVMSYLTGQKHYPIPYDVKKALAYLSTAVIIVIISYHFLNRNLIAGNILFIAFAAGLAYVERKDLRKIITGNIN
ncbi:lipopolysaccharide biosynthesis protein [Arcticibacter eurypsychrophilus]|uniref:lipopolysaccharide biosynthesis protein n=1 Tax=Arcticibacter eurypsychrophilus TaxID=1434752 RepID=UPI000B10317E|nr:MATE family efflux transporter [Arcticibacter eurypsychrophilus]